MSGLSEQDQDLIKALNNDKEKGLQTLFGCYYKPLCVYAMKFLDDIYVSEDIVQEIFIRFWEDKKHKSIQGSLKSYLFTSVRNRSINYLTNSKVIRTEYIKHLNREFAFHQFDDDEVQEKKKRLHQEISKLPPQSQKVLRMIIFEKKKYKEVSEDMNISINTVKTHFSRALKHLRNSIDLIALLMIY